MDAVPFHSYCVYLLHCSDDSFYVGHTSNLRDRVKVHNEGRGATWTACRRPVSLVYCEAAHSEEDAIRRELQLKGWTHAKKLALITGDLARLKSLSKRRVK